MAANTIGSPNAPQSQPVSGDTATNDAAAKVGQAQNGMSAGIGKGEPVATLPPVPIERQPSAAPPANARAHGTTISPQAMGFLIGTMGMPAATAVALYSGKSTENLNAMGDEVESWNLGTRTLGALGAAGGAAETVAGGVTFAAGVGTSEVAVGIPVAAFGGIVIAHGADTFWAGAETVWTGETADTRTVGVLKGIGMPPLAANLTDAGLGIAFSLGSYALMRSPRVATAVLANETAAVTTAETAKTVAAETLVQEAGGRIAVELKDYMSVGIQQAGNDYAMWGSVLPDGHVLYKLDDAFEANALHIPIPAENAERAAFLLTDKVMGGPTTDMDLVQDIFEEAGVRLRPGVQAQLDNLRQEQALWKTVERQAEDLQQEAAMKAAMLQGEGPANDAIYRLSANSSEIMGIDDLSRLNPQNDFSQTMRTARSWRQLNYQAAEQLERAEIAAYDAFLKGVEEVTPDYLQRAASLEQAASEAAQLHDQANKALNAATATHAAAKETVQRVVPVAVGAHALRAGETIPLAELSPDTIIEFGPGPAEPVSQED